MRTVAKYRRRYAWPKRLALACACASVWMAHSLAAAPPLPAQVIATEYELKAAFLYNFARFVRWPGAPGETFPICVYGEETLAAQLHRVVGGKAIDARPIEVREVDQPGEMRQCRILFVGEVEPAAIADLLRQLHGASVLTVSDHEDFARSGGIVQFRRDGNRLRLDINLEKAEQANLKISSQLLKLARIVEESKN
ncbi:MAG TPA: YfiR family protein [Terriglobales bacterium]|nr:YfiR family protein [Terriglobales bacterium]